MSFNKKVISGDNFSYKSMGLTSSKKQDFPEFSDILYQQVRERLKIVPSTQRNPQQVLRYPLTRRKPWLEEVTTWELLADPREYTRLLLSTTRISVHPRLTPHVTDSPG